MLDLLSRHLGPLPSIRTQRGTLDGRTDSLCVGGQKPMQGMIARCAQPALLSSAQRIRLRKTKNHMFVVLKHDSTVHHRWKPGASLPGGGDEERRAWRTSTHLLFNHVGRLVVEDGPQAVRVSWRLWVQGEVQGHINGGKFVPEVFLILHRKQKKTQ